jgi:hypothetical protein
MSEYFRRVIIKFFLKKQLMSAKIATSMIIWRHSGFSVDASARRPDDGKMAGYGRRMSMSPQLLLSPSRGWFLEHTQGPGG